MCATRPCNTRPRPASPSGEAGSGAVLAAPASSGGLSPRRASVSDDAGLPWELIDALLGGCGSGEAANGWGSGPTGEQANSAAPLLPQPADAADVAPPERPADAGRVPRQADGSALSEMWRCLDPTHASAAGGSDTGVPACGCVAPPSAADLPFFRLSSPRRCGESGEKRLRRLLIASPEWRSQAERVKLAERVEAVGDSSLAEVLRAGRCSALRKGTMAQLCRHWGYRCDVFRSLSAPAAGGGDDADAGEETQPSPRNVRRRVTPGGAERELAALPPLSMRGAATWLQGNPLAGTVLASPSSVAASPASAVDALRVTITRVVMPLMCSALMRHAGAETVPQLIRDPAGLVMQRMADRLSDNELCIRMIDVDVTHRSRRVGQAQAAAGAARFQSTAGSYFPAPPPASRFTPAWAMLRGSDSLLLDSMRTVSGMMGRGMALQDALASRLAAVAPLTPAQRAWFADLTAYCETVLCALAHLEGAAATLRLAPWPVYLEAVVCAEETLHQFSAGVLNSLRRRREWMLAAAAHGAGAEGPTPEPMSGLREYAVAMAAPLQMPPLVVH